MSDGSLMSAQSIAVVVLAVCAAVAAIAASYARPTRVIIPTWLAAGALASLAAVLEISNMWMTAK